MKTIKKNFIGTRQKMCLLESQTFWLECFSNGNFNWGLQIQTTFATDSNVLGWL